MLLSLGLGVAQHIGTIACIHIAGIAKLHGATWGVVGNDHGNLPSLTFTLVKVYLTLVVDIWQLEMGRCLHCYWGLVLGWRHRLVRALF